MAGTVRKADLIRPVAEAAGISRGQAEKAINALLDNIAVEVSAGNEVSLHGFGVFKQSYRKASVSALTHTTIPAMTTVRFKPHSGLKQVAQD